MKKLITHRWIPQDGFRVHRCKFCGVVRHWDGGYQRLMFKWTGGQGYAPPKCKRTIHSDKTL